MAISFTTTPTSSIFTKYKALNIIVAGATASTDYIMSVTDPAGGVTRLPCTTDGAGAVTVVYVPQSPGTLTADLRPVTEHLGTTTAAQTANKTITCPN